MSTCYNEWIDYILVATHLLPKFLITMWYINIQSDINCDGLKRNHLKLSSWEQNVSEHSIHCCRGTNIIRSICRIFRITRIKLHEGVNRSEAKRSRRKNNICSHKFYSYCAIVLDNILITVNLCMRFLENSLTNENQGMNFPFLLTCCAHNNTAAD